MLAETKQSNFLFVEAYNMQKEFLELNIKFLDKEIQELQR